MRLFGWSGKFYFPEIEIRWPKKCAFDHGNAFTLLFYLQRISGKWERARERARARRRSSGIASSSSSPRSRSTARSRRRSQSREEGEIAIRRDRDLGSLRAVIAISMGLFLSVVAVCWRKTHGVDNNGNTLFRVQSFSVKDLGGSGFVHFCSRGDWFNYSVLFYQTNVLIKFSVAMRRSLLRVFFFCCCCSYSSLSCQQY